MSLNLQKKGYFQSPSEVVLYLMEKQLACANMAVDRLRSRYYKYIAGANKEGSFYREDTAKLMFDQIVSMQGLIDCFSGLKLLLGTDSFFSSDDYYDKQAIDCFLGDGAKPGALMSMLSLQPNLLRYNSHIDCIKRPARINFRLAGLSLTNLKSITLLVIDSLISGLECRDMYVNSEGLDAGGYFNSAIEPDLRYAELIELCHLASKKWQDVENENNIRISNLLD